jgi:hypothetical protein
MKTLLSIAFCFFFSLSIYAQNAAQTDSVSFPVSPLFNSAKINEPGDPYFHGGTGQTNDVSWGYQGDKFPTINLRLSNTGAVYLGYNEQGAYIKDDYGKVYMFDGTNLKKLTNNKAPDHLYNDSQKYWNELKAKAVSSYTPPKTTTTTHPATTPEVLGTVKMASGRIQGQYNMSFEGASDTTSYTVTRVGPASTNPGGMFVTTMPLKADSKARPTSAKTGEKYYLLFQVYPDGEHYVKQAIPESAAKGFLGTTVGSQ